VGEEFLERTAQKALLSAFQPQSHSQSSEDLNRNKANNLRRRMSRIEEDSSYDPYIEDESNEEEESADESPPTKIQKGKGKFFASQISSRPWKSAVREPSEWLQRTTLDSNEPPAASLELTYVYGYRGWDCRNNVAFADSPDEIAYHIAGVGVVLTVSDNSQVLNTEHNDDILCLAVHPQGHTVATGEIGKAPLIVLWDANTGVTLRSILFHQRGVLHISFTADGNKVVSVGFDPDGIVAVHDVQTGIIVGSGKVGRGVTVHVLAVCANDNFITAGRQHVKFWDLSNKSGGRVELPSKGGLFGKNVYSRCVTAAAYLDIDAVTGMSDGTILLWKGRSNTKSIVGHQGAVTSMTSIPASNSGANTGRGDTGPRVLTAGKDGQIYMWNSQLMRVWQLDMTQTTPEPYSVQIQAMAFKEGKLAVGTKAAELYLVNMLSSETRRIVCGHFNSSAEVHALSVHPSNQTFVTVGDDYTVRVWDSKARVQKYITHLGSKIRACAFHPQGFQIAVGLFDGKVVVLTENLDTILAESPVAAEWIQTLVFSPNGHLLAVGSYDTNIYILETRNYNIRSVCRAHPMCIIHLDFSVCSRYLQSTSKAYDLFFWDVSGEIVELISTPTIVRDIKWQTWTSVVGWPVQVYR
jgi:echinoderm microtubule-associated protein-like 6